MTGRADLSIFNAQRQGPSNKEKLITSSSGNTRSTLLVMACVIVIIAGARAAAPLLVPFLLSLFIAIICASPVKTLQARGLPSWLAASIVLTGIIGAFAFMFVVLGGSIDTFTAALPGYQQQFSVLRGEAITWLSGHGVNVNTQAINAAFDPGKAIGFFAGFLGGLGETLSNIMLILFTVVFLMLEASGFSAKMAAHDPQDHGSFLLSLEGLVASMNDYIATKSLVSMLTGLLVWLGLFLMDVEFAALWAFFAFLLNFVPTVGSIVAAVPVLLLSLLEMNPGLTLAIAGLYVVINLLIGNVVEPAWMGKKVGLSTLAVFLSLVFWGWMFGPIGMLISVPLTMVIKFLAEQNNETLWLAILLGSAPEPAASAPLDSAE